MFERIHNYSKLSKRAIRSLVGGTALFLAGGSLAACGESQSSSNHSMSISAIRAAAVQEAMYYDEAGNIAGHLQNELQSGKVVVDIQYLNGKITDKKKVGAAAKEYGTIYDPIFLVPGPDSKGGAKSKYTDADLDGGFVGAQSLNAMGQVTVEAVPFDKETMHYTPSTNTNPNLRGPLMAMAIKVENLHGSIQGSFAVAVNSETLQPIYYDGALIIPGFSPN